MTHFPIIVALPAADQNLLEGLLAPYDEDLRSEFVADADEEPDEQGRRGYWRNPQAKWDWWVVGGRWSGRVLLTHEGKRVDSARKAEVDFDGMRREARQRAEAQLAIYDAAVAAYGEPPSGAWTSLDWTTEREKYEKAREAFWNHPTVKALSGHRDPNALLGIMGAWEFSDLDAVKADRAGWLTHRELLGGVGSLHALLTHGGEWLDDGEMGWFGMHEDNPDKAGDYLAKATRYIADLPDDFILTVVDCHI